MRRTKIVATIGPASHDPEMMRRLVRAGMNVARLNFSHGTYADHAQSIAWLRQVARELDAPISLLQDLQGPKIRVGQIAERQLQAGETVGLTPHLDPDPALIPIDYPHLAEDAQSGTPVLLDDGLLELRVVKVADPVVYCQVVQGGVLKSRKGVNLPSLNLRLPSLTDKDRQDLEFGLRQGIDWISLSFVRQAEDISHLKQVIADLGQPQVPIIAKIEKPQAIEHLEAILEVCDGVMVARGDLGVEMRPEKVPLLQKRIIRACNQRGIPVITATQMLQSMIDNPRPTRAEASDVANAILDGTDAVMLSGESAVGQFPVESVETMVRIALEVEQRLEFANLPPHSIDDTRAISEALNAIDKILDLGCIATFTTTGYSARLAAAERPRAPIVAYTPDPAVFHRLNLIWGVTPMLLTQAVPSVENLVEQIEASLVEKNLAARGDSILILGGSPVQQAKGTNFLKLHTIGLEL